MRVVIVGASLAGSHAAEMLRAKGFEGEIVLVGAEEHLPYDRPPLSKAVLAGKVEPDQVALRPPAKYEELDIQLRLGSAAVELDPSASKLSLADGERISYDALVIATGSHARLLPDMPDLDGIFVLRTLDDALKIRDAFDANPRVVVVGGGFIGAEVAATARTRGLDVTILEALAAPLARGVGLEMGEALGRLHTRHGTALRCGVGVAGFVGEHHVEGVRLAGGELVEADLVVVGVGAVPSTDWLTSSGLELRDGVVCDDRLRAVGTSNVYAIGDIARWPSTRYGEELRLEHWTNATEQAMHVAEMIVGEDGAFDPVPYVWSDQYEHVIQVVGHCRAGDQVEVLQGAPGEGPFVATYQRDGQFVGALAVDAPRPLMKLRRLLGQGGSADDARQLVTA